MVRKEKKRKRYPDVASCSTLWRRRRCEVMAIHGPSHSVHVVKLSITIWKKKSKIWNFKNIPAWGCVSWDHVVSGLDLRHSRWEKKLCLRHKRCRRRPCFLFECSSSCGPVSIACCDPLLSYLNRGGGFQSCFASRIAMWQHVPLSCTI